MGLGRLMGLLRVPSVQVPRGKPGVSDSQEGFAGGENPKGAANIIPPDQCAVTNNMRVVREGEIAKRPGLRSVGTIGTDQMLFSWASSAMDEFGTLATNILSIGPSSHTVAPKGYVFDYTVPAHVPQLNLQSTYAVTAADYETTAYGTTFRDATGDCLYVGVAGATGFLKWKGSTVTPGIASAFQTGIGCLWVYNQRLFGVKGGLTAKPSGPSLAPYARTATLYYSGLNDGDTLGDTANGGGSATIRAYGASPKIVGGFAIGNSNFILHENAISVFRGTTFDDINITAGAQGVSPNIGFPLGWAVIDEVGYVVTQDGLFLVTEGGGVTPASSAAYPDPIWAAFQTNPNTVSFQQMLGEPWFVLDNARRNEVWIVGTFYNSGSNTRPNARVFIYNKMLGRFTGQGTFGIPVWWAGTVIPYGLTDPQMLFLGNSGAVYGCDFLYDGMQVYQDAGSNYTSSVQLRRMFSREAPGDQKAWRRALVQMGSGAGQTAATVGSATGATLSYTNATGTVNDTTALPAQTTTPVDLSGQGSSIDLTITDSGASSTGWSVMRVEASGNSLGARGG